ncbi:hypothetical protein MPER_07190, partial [Moniliophthora perniciosa FA553]
AGAVSNLYQIIKAAQLRLGIEAMVLVVRNHTDPFMAPQWLWTNSKRNDFLRTFLRLGFRRRCGQNGGVLDELITKSDDQAKFYKGEIRVMAQSKLGALLGHPVNAVPYELFEKSMTLSHGIVPEGRTCEFVNPSRLSSTIDKLSTLYRALKEDKAGFRKLDVEEWDQWKDDYFKSFEDGTRVPKPRKKRSDAEKTPAKKTTKTKTDGGQDDVEEEEDASEQEEVETGKSKSKTGKKKKGNNRKRGAED